MASEGLWGAGAGNVSEGCSRELCDAKSARRWTISMRFSTTTSPLAQAAHPLRLSSAALQS
eukprot:3843516-Prymnesium_polylepis.1